MNYGQWRSWNLDVSHEHVSKMKGRSLVQDCDLQTHLGNLVALHALNAFRGVCLPLFASRSSLTWTCPIKRPRMMWRRGVQGCHGETLVERMFWMGSLAVSLNHLNPPTRLVWWKSTTSLDHCSWWKWWFWFAMWVCPKVPVEIVNDSNFFWMIPSAN